MDEPFVREYHEDRELTAWFLLDLSPSVDFGTADMDRRKRTVLIDFVTTLARLLTRRGNRVGAVLDGGGVRHTIPAGSGRVQVLRIADALLREPRRSSAPFTDLAPLLDAGHQAIKRRSLVFVISDFISEPGWERSLDLLDRRHEVMAVRLVDPREIALPDVGPVILEDAETGEQLYVDTGDPAFRRRFAAAAEDREAAIGESLPAGRRRCRLPVDRRGPRPRDRPDGRPSSPAAARVMTFVWPQPDALVLIPLGSWLPGDRSAPARKVAAFGGRDVGSVAPAIGRRGTTTRPSPTPPGRAGAPSGRRDPRGPRDPARGRLHGHGHRPRPAAGPIDVPRQEGTVILAFDISGSMAATDLQPTRMEAAIAAATDFVQRQPPSVVIGVVAFSDCGHRGPAADQRPGDGARRDRPPRAAARDIARPAASWRRSTRSRRRRRPHRGLLQQPLAEPTPAPTPVPPGSHAPAVIVLLTDGENNERPDPMAAAQAAADRGVRIYTVGIGSAAGADARPRRVPGPHPARRGRPSRQIADLTGGTYYAADDAATLDSVYQHLDTALVVRTEDDRADRTARGAGLALLLAGAIASLAWLGRLP